jgi:putative transposase
MDHVVRRLLARLVTLGIRIKLVLLDRGFDSVRVIRDLITAELPFIMPALKRGKSPRRRAVLPAPMRWQLTNKAAGRLIP